LKKTEWKVLNLKTQQMNWQKNSEVGFFDASYSVDSPVLGKELYIESTGSSKTSFFQTTRTALNNGEPIPSLAKYWKATPAQVVLRSCEDSVFLIKVNDRLIKSYQIKAITQQVPVSTFTGTCDQALDANNQCSGNYKGGAFTKSGTEATIVLNKNLVRQFCNPGNALQQAFEVDNSDGLLTGATTLNIQLHADAGPFYLKGSLQVISRSPVLQQVQNVVYNAGELTLTFPGPHRQVTGNIVKVIIPGKSKSKDAEVPLTVINAYQLKVRYTNPVHTGQFEGYTFKPNKKIICITGIRVQGQKQRVRPEKNIFTTGANLEQIAGATKVGEGTVTVGKKIDGAGCFEATMSNSQPLVNSEVLVDRIYCPNPPCTYYCHGGSMDLSTELPATQVTSYTTTTSGQVKFPSAAVASLSGSELIVGLQTHSCGKSGVKIGELMQNPDGTNTLVPWCDPTQPGMQCVWTSEKELRLKTTKGTYYQLDGAVMAPYEAGQLVPKTSGFLSKFKKITFSAAGHYNNTYKPIIAPADVIMPPPTFKMPSMTPSRSDDGDTRHDIDTSYMKRYNMRLIKIFNENAELTINNIQFENAGISDDVDFNPTYVQHLPNSPIQTIVASATLDRILIDPNVGDAGAAADARPAYALFQKFCDKSQPLIESITGAVGKRHGGAIFFSGKSFKCTGCTFRNNRVTGNGGAVFLESPQSGRVVVDPDLDGYTDDNNYKERIDLQSAGAPINTMFFCNKCHFENNLAMSITRGPVNTFDSLTGGFGGAISISLGIRYKRILEKSSLTKIVSIRRAFASHGSMDASITNGSTFINNYAWKSGGAINVLGGRTVAKRSILKIAVQDTTFTENGAVQGDGGAIKMDKGSPNGDYKCAELTCDSKHFKATIKASVFGNNYAGKAKEFSDVNGNSELDDDVSAWRHVSNFDKPCDATCCDMSRVVSSCTMPNGETTKCRTHTDGDFTCNDGLYLEGTKTTNLCTISAKSTTKCPAGYHQGRMPGRCIPCEAGRYQGVSTLDSDLDAFGNKITECKICSPGKYSVGTSVNGKILALSCTLCEGGKYQNLVEQTSCNDCSEVIKNSDGVTVGATTSRVCSCAAKYYDARTNINTSDTTELDPKNPDTTRCRECPKVGDDYATDCTVPGQTLSDLVAKRGFYRSNPKTVKFFKCKDVDFPGIKPETSTHCLGGIVDGELKKSVRRLTVNNTNISLSNSSTKLASQCAEGRIGPLCNRCGPFGEYLEQPDPDNDGRTICRSCKELKKTVDYGMLTTVVGFLLLFLFYGFSLFSMTRTGMIFQMMDEDDSGSIDVKEYTDAVRRYAGYTKDQISDGTLAAIFKAFDVDEDEEIREKEFLAMWTHTHERVRNPTGAAKSLHRDLEKVVAAMNKKEKDVEKKEKRETHVRAIGDLNVNATFVQGVQENEERLQQAVTESGDPEFIADSAQETQENSGEHMELVEKPEVEDQNAPSKAPEDEEAPSKSPENEETENNTSTEGGDESKTTESQNETEVSNEEITVDMPEVNVTAPKIEIPKVNVPKVDVPKVTIPAVNLEGLKNIGPTVKIIFGWGQILSSFNITFSVKWPVEFNALMTAMYAPFNVDLFSFFKDFGCFVPTSYTVAFYMHMAMVPILLGIILAAWCTAQAYKKIMCCKLCKPHYDNKTLYARVLKLSNLVIFLMYPGLGLRIFRVFALSCFEPKLKAGVDPLDPNIPDDEKYTEDCEPGTRYMTSDLSVKESDIEYQKMLTWAYVFMIIYVFGIPAIYMYVLYRKRHVIARDPDEPGEAVHKEDHQEVMKCRTEFGSMYKDYKRKYYWFELVEMTRKISLVGALVMFGNGGMQIFAGIIICFLYVLLTSYLEPLTNKTDQVLQYLTSIQLFCTLISGLMINYRTFEQERGIGDSAHDQFLAIWLMFSTVVVIVVILAVFGSMCMALSKMKKKKAADKSEDEEEVLEDKGKAVENPLYEKENIPATIDDIKKDDDVFSSNPLFEPKKPKTAVL
jgi:hypothetical protein